jgi:para-aminobenzoate synthetase/4-amino-4-deoxychorismate lyase
LLRAVFPCGSITGAPKQQSMRHIAALESTPRGLYCGAIGWLDAAPEGAALGNFCLSVAIRTLTLGPSRQGGRAATLGVGSGIVLDSRADQEYQETLWKARFLSATDPGLGLFETLRWQGGHLHQWPHHLHRLQHSARALGFPCDADALNAALQHYTQALDPAHPLRIRLDLDHQGRIQLCHAPLQPLPAGPVALVLSRRPLPEAEQTLRRHKTTQRMGYDAAIAAAAAMQAFDAVFINAAGEVTEGARSNLLAKIDGRWCTPSLHSGVLPGVMRRRLLQRWPALQLRVLPLEDLLQAQEMAVCNALRGVMRACWRTDAQGQPVEI